ncbi:MAG: hypothetical protein CHACPFDD_02473 [Phycisphaerae bacterium]|nr:hypothetical protein [Phycisphaerae bacterium]
MRRRTLILRSVRYYARTHAAAAAGALVGCAALCGALLVGTSVSASLRAVALERLCGLEHAVESSRLFDARLARDLAARWPNAEVAAALLLRGGAQSAAGPQRSGKVQIVAAGADFWRLVGLPSEVTPPSDGAVINQALADELHAAAGDEILLRVAPPAVIPSESLMGRRDAPIQTLRVRVTAVLPDRGPGAFELSPSQRPPRSAFLDLAEIQRRIRRPDQVNTLAVRGVASAEELRGGLHACATPADHGLRIAPHALAPAEGATFEYAALESEQMVLPAAVERAALEAARQAGVPTSRVLTYLANTIRRAGAAPDAASVPYSIVSAVETAPPFPPIAPGELPIGQAVLNDWTAERLAARPGDAIEITYYMLDPGGRLRTETRALIVAAVVPLSAAAADRGLTPAYPGINDARRMSDWDPPFPIDYRRIGSDDEEYWDAHGTTPKLFISLQTGQAFWAAEEHGAARFGRLTSIRIAARAGEALAAAVARFEKQLLAELPAESTGLLVRPVRESALAGARGATDFAGLFIGFSMFLIASAALLLVLLQRLSIEQRSREVGLLLAVGTPPRVARRLLLAEGAAVAAVGSLLGVPAAVGYAWLMLAGLRTLWRGAVGTSRLGLHVSAADLAFGTVAALAVALLATLWSLRALRARSTSDLLAGRAPETTLDRHQLAARAYRRGLWRIVSGAAAIAALSGSMLTDGATRAGLFFAAGGALLAVLLLTLAGRTQQRSTLPSGRGGLTRLGFRNAARRHDRTMLTTSLIACATFLVVAVGASRHQPGADALRRDGGTGGFALLAETDVPLLYDPSTPEGRDELFPSGPDRAALDSTPIYALRRRPGDDASCLNLFRPTAPAILGVPPALIARGGFSFAATRATTPGQRANPWTLLDSTFADGAIPAFGDYNTVVWLLHLGLGGDVTVRDDAGREVRLRIVGLLSGSIFQSELLVSERNFLTRFPQQPGYSVLLIDAPAATAGAAAGQLENALGSYGCDVTPSLDRIASYLVVENTYLSTFQMLGGLGLLLGTLGTAAVVLRNVLERRGELALLAACGYTRADVRRVVLSESALMIVGGLACGALAAVLATLPNAISNARHVPWASLLGLLALVAAAGLGAAWAAASAALRAPLLSALRTN